MLEVGKEVGALKLESARSLIRIQRLHLLDGEEEMPNKILAQLCSPSQNRRRSSGNHRYQSARLYSKSRQAVLVVLPTFNRILIGSNKSVLQLYIFVR